MTQIAFCQICSQTLQASNYSTFIFGMDCISSFQTTTLEITDSINITTETNVVLEHIPSSVEIIGSNKISLSGFYFSLHSFLLFQNFSFRRSKQ